MSPRPIGNGTGKASSRLISLVNNWKLGKGHKIYHHFMRKTLENWASKMAEGVKSSCSASLTS